MSKQFSIQPKIKRSKTDDNVKENSQQNTNIEQNVQLILSKLIEQARLIKSFDERFSYQD